MKQFLVNKNKNLLQNGFGEDICLMPNDQVIMPGNNIITMNVVFRNLHSHIGLVLKLLDPLFDDCIIIGYKVYPEYVDIYIKNFSEYSIDVKKGDRFATMSVFELGILTHVSPSQEEPKPTKKRRAKKGI